jgi:homoserine kinase
MDQIRIFSPATIANVSCGYDAMAFALQDLGEEMTFRKIDTPGVRITKITGTELPYEVHKNAAGVVALAMLKDSGATFGVEIEIWKEYKPGSGLGSSAASSAGAAFGVNKLLGEPYSKLELLGYAMMGEEVACGSPIADNVAAALYGGFVLIRSYDPLEVISIPTPKDLMMYILHPQIEVKTEDARRVVPTEIPIKTAVAQWANVGGLISGLYTSDYDLIGRSMKDYVAEPYRKQFIPHFDELKEVATKAGALGMGIAGSGPSVFAFTKGLKTAGDVGLAFVEVYEKTNIEYNVYVSGISKDGVRIIKD